LPPPAALLHACLSTAAGSDCLETIDENGVENDEVFRHAGGRELLVVPCVNSDGRWCSAAAEIVRAEAAGWF